MVDGLVYLMETVPKKLPYRYGREHLAILYRPIPRALWPGKPVDNYMLRAIGLDKDREFTIGISPSLFGDFYLEGGYVGVILLSVLYGYGLGRLLRWSARIHAFGGLMVRGIVCASFTLLLRGGDMAGVCAWIVMSFWPIFLLFAFRKQYLRPDSPWFVNLSAVQSRRGRGRDRSRRISPHSIAQMPPNSSLAPASPPPADPTAGEDKPRR
jgi:hypothetical protein